MPRTTAPGIRGLCAAVLIAGMAACGDATTSPASPPEDSAGEDGAVTAADGRLADPVPVDADVPALVNLDADLLAAVRQAASDAAADGIEVLITSGWRSSEYQEELFAQGVAEHGSTEEAARWVAPPDESHHVTGQAVDVGYTDAAYWMSAHGSRYGLCQMYVNEIWHYELATDPGDSCPAPLADAAG